MKLRRKYFLSFLLLSIVPSLFSIGIKHPEAQNAVKFTINKSQWEKQVLFRAQLDGGALFLEKNCFTYNFYDKETLRKNHVNKNNEPGQRTNDQISSHAFRVTFLNALETPIVSASKATPDYSNFYIGKDKSKWVSEVNSFKEVYYKNIYSGIDLQVLAMQNSMKYNFIVAPNASVNDIKLNYEGLDELYISKGALIMKTSLNEIMEQSPVAYQIIDGRRVEVPCKFVLEKNTVHFYFPKGYNKNAELVIDPILVFACTSGSIADNFGMTATYDAQGNLYSGGTVFGIGYPVTLGAFDPTWNGISTYVSGRTDVVITKYDSSGTFLQYSTYLGGTNGTEVVSSLIVNSLNQLMLFGATGSNDFPVTATAFDTSFNGGPGLVFGANGTQYSNGTDLYVAKFNAGGTALLASTYVGGTQNEGANNSTGVLVYNYGDYYRGEIQVDNAGNFYVASCTYSSDFPVTPGALQTVAGGGMDGVIFKMDPNLNGLIWSTYLGGNQDDGCYALTLDNLSNVYTTGGTASSNFPSTAGVLGTTYNGGQSDGYITKIKYDGSTILNSTFIGTNSYDQSFLIQLDNSDNVYIIGQSMGNMPVSPGVYFNPNSQQFIWKVNNTFTTALFTTIFGNGNGQVNISPCAFLVDICGNIYVCGWGGNILLGTPTVAMPVSPGAYQSSTDGFNFYLFVLAPNATTLLYGTYFGGPISQEHVDGGTSRFDKKGIVYQAVCANCGGYTAANQHDDFPVTPGSWPNTGADVNHNTQNFNCNQGVFKFDFQVSGVSADAVILPNDTICPGDNVTFSNVSSNAFSYLWDFGDSSPTSTQTSPVHTYPAPGTYNVTLIAIDSTGCIFSDTSNLTVVVAPFPIVDIGNDTTVCQQPSIVLDAGTSGNIYLWSDGGITQTIVANDTGTYWVEVSNGHCEATDSIEIQQTFLDPFLGNDTSLCTGQTLTLSVFEPGLTYFWSTFATTPTITVSAPGQYWVQVASGLCTETDTIVVSYISYPVIGLPPSIIICPNDSFLLDAGSPATSYLWSTGETTQTVYADSLGTYLVTVSNQQCSSVDSTVVQQIVLPPLVDDTTLCAGQSITLNVFSAGANYLWSTGATTPSITVSTPGQYWITSTLSACINKDTMNISYLPYPVINLPAIVDICPNNTVVLNAGTSATTYLWSNGTTGQTLDVSSGGTYFVTASNLHCSVSDTTIVNATPPVVWESTGTLCNVEKYTLDAGVQANSYLWSTGETTPSIDVVDAGTYWVVANTNNCVLSDTMTIDGYFGNGVLWFPNTFTPNSNGLNDKFTGKGSDITYFDLMIFNRWGELIFETENQEEGWDGFYKGKLAEQDVYVWKVKYKALCSEDQILSKIGHVTVVR